MLHNNVVDLTQPLYVSRHHQCDRIVTWNAGALHYSDEIKLVRQLSDMTTERQALKANIKTIKYIGKGTYTDCAIKRGIAELLIG